MRPFVPVVALAISALVAPAGVRAQQPAAGEPVPLYTNADLEKFGPPSGPNEPVWVQDKGEWQFVREFLDRAYARLDAERRHDLERAAMDRVPPSGRPRYALPYAGYWGYPAWRPYGSPRWNARPPDASGRPPGARGNEGATRPDRGMPRHPEPMPREPLPARPRPLEPHAR
jgi:hypothetical protein